MLIHEILFFKNLDKNNTNQNIKEDVGKWGVLT